MENNRLDESIGRIPMDDNPDERNKYLQTLKNIDESTQDLSKIIMEIKNDD